MATEEEINERIDEEIEEAQEDEREDMMDEQAMNQKEWSQEQEVPEPAQQLNSSAFLYDSLKATDPEKVTHLDIHELGRPLFNLRFLLDIEDICKYYLDDLFKTYKIKNKIAQYFREKIDNISASGMSKEGFVQNLNVTKKMDVSKKRIKNLSNLKGGKITQ